MVPALVHAGPFANIAHGCNSVIALNTLKLKPDLCYTEAGFGAGFRYGKVFYILSNHISITNSSQCGCSCCND